ncbi:MAG: hypothetical protein JNJ46_00910 [Myxococcales bacterium]|nr:hypothetical protein [Myxococcales bacterium]
MSRLRWSLGALLVALSLLASAAALRTYVVHRLWLGGLAVLLLAVIAIAGFASLARARRRLAAELSGLLQTPPSGSLFSERRRQLESLHAQGARPDLDALSQATAAVELGHAYLGKYLVAVTVLVGLVGTFAGLMETLRGVAPLLADEQITTLKALAGPLAGLDVTFGASLVGILVTLALALVQGDLALAEEATLSRLEERTRHVLVPALWPPAESADERSVRELAALRAELTQFIAKTADATSERVARVAQTEIDRLVKSLEASLTSTVQNTAGRVEQGLLSLASLIEAKLGPVFAEQKDQLLALQQASERAATLAVAAGTQTATHIRHAAGEALSGLQESTQQVTQAQTQLLRDAQAAHDRLTDALHRASERLHQALHSLAEQQSEQARSVLAAHTSDLQQLAHSRDALLRTSEQALDALLRTSEQALDALHRRQTAQAAELQAQQHTAVVQIEQALTQSQRAHATQASELHAAQTQQIAQLHADHAQHLGQLYGQLADQLGHLQIAQVGQQTQLQTQHHEVATRIEQALQALHAAQASRLTAMTEALCHALQQTVGSEGTRLGEAAQALQVAAQDLATAAGSVSSPLSALTPELQALSREVALMAARSDAEESSATLSELLRLGEGIERLEALLRMSQGVAEHMAPAATPERGEAEDDEPGQVA